MKVNVYGNGLSAYLAVHAARTLGHETTLVQDSSWDVPPESLYLGMHVPGITTTPYRLRRTVEGSMQAFQTKAGPLARELEKLPEDAMRSSWAWNPHEVLAELQEKYDHLVWGDGEQPEADFEITAAPADQTCQDDDCDFGVLLYWETPFMRYSGIGENCIVGSGDEDDWWHTCFNLPGAQGTWYPYAKPPRQGHARREAPSGTTCTCNPHQLRVGAGGTWDATYRTELSFYDTLRALVEARA